MTNDIEELRSQAFTDELTALPNRRALEELAQSWLGSGELAISVAMVDIDFFKSFNDRFGHASGDECLRRVAAVLQASCEHGVAGRYGGEEFLLLFRDCDLPTAVSRAEAVRQAVAGIEFSPDGDEPVPISVSIGVAPVRVDQDDAFHRGVRDADAALYRAKESGRDRVVAHDARAERRNYPQTAQRVQVPSLRTPLLGRDQTIAELARQLESSPMLTLVGPGGVGKSSLAVALARRIADRFPHGVLFFELTTVHDPAVVGLRLAERFGLRAPDAEHALTALETFLRRQRFLLVLDNCEHVADAVRTLANAMMPAQSLRILATSRQPLNADGERVVRVDSLDEESAVALFSASAPEAVRSTLQGAPATVASICRHLDGLPLAIELAAAQLGTLSLEELARTLEGAAGDTLDALYRMSYEQLNETQRGVFRSMAAFAGGWQLSAAAHVAAIEVDETLDVLTSLVRRSLVVRSDSDETGYRFDMLETAREFARARSQAATEWAMATRRHREAVALRLEKANVAWESTPTQRWLPPLARELANIRLALSGDGEVAATTELARARLDALPVFYDLGLPREGLSYAEAALAVLSSPTDRARAARWCAAYYNAMWRFAEGRSAADSAVDLARAAGDDVLVADALTLAAASRIALNEDSERSATYLRRALELSEQCPGHHAIAAFAHSLLGVRDIIERHDGHCAFEHLETAYALYAGFGRLDGMARTLTNIGIALDVAGGRSLRSLAAAAEAVAILERMHNTSALAVAMNNLASLLSEVRAYTEAMQTASRALELNLAAGNRLQTARSLLGIGEAAIRTGIDVPNGVRLYGFKRAEYARSNTPLQAHTLAASAATLDLALHDFTEEERTSLLLEGERMTLDEAIDAAETALRAASRER